MGLVLSGTTRPCRGCRRRGPGCWSSCSPRPARSAPSTSPPRSASTSTPCADISTRSSMTGWPCATGRAPPDAADPHGTTGPTRQNPEPDARVREYGALAGALAAHLIRTSPTPTDEAHVAGVEWGRQIVRDRDTRPTVHPGPDRPRTARGPGDPRGSRVRPAGDTRRCDGAAAPVPPARRGPPVPRGGLPGAPGPHRRRTHRARRRRHRRQPAALRRAGRMPTGPTPRRLAGAVMTTTDVHAETPRPTTRRMPGRARCRGAGSCCCWVVGSRCSWAWMRGCCCSACRHR